MVQNLFIFAVSIFLIIKGATMSTTYAFRIAKNFNLSKYVVGFIIVAVISIIPETLVSVNSAIAGVPALGLGTLFGSNIADLTLLFAIIIFVSHRGIKIESKILKENIIYPFFLVIPILLGLDGYYSRWEGLTLVIAGLLFYYLAFRNSNGEAPDIEVQSEVIFKNRYKDIFLLIFSMAVMLIGSHFIVDSTVFLANYIGISSVVIGMLIVGVGTTMPELFFCIAAVRKNHDSLAIGDIFGTVLADATVLVGIIALIEPFFFPKKIIYSAGIFMVVASFLLLYFMRSGKFLSKKESYLLFLFWVLFVMTEIILNSLL